MTTATAARPAREAAPDQAARTVLGWGAGLMIVGLGLVGIGSDDLGMVPVLAGLLLILYGIHSYGRLGPEGERAPADGAETGPDAVDLEAARSTAWSAVWMGGLAALAGLLVIFGSSAGHGATVVIAYGAILGGGFRLVRGLGALSRLNRGSAGARGSGPPRKDRERPVPARVVEKRRRMNKSAPP